MDGRCLAWDGKYPEGQHQGFAEQHEVQLRELKEACGEAMLGLKFRKRLQCHLDSIDD
ncbi:MAG TPA: hypothetical protein VIK82_06630 [Porticoccaceae bacterium]